MKHNLILLYCYFIRTITLIFPDIPFIMRFRGFLYSFVLKECGRNFQVAASANLRGIENIKIKNNVYLAPNVFLLSRIGIIIENDVLIGINTVISDSNHGKKNNSYRLSRGKTEPVHIKDGSWVASNCTITAGSKIGKNCIIGACSVVNSTIKDNCVVLSSSHTFEKRKNEE